MKFQTSRMKYWTQYWANFEVKHNCSLFARKYEHRKKTNHRMPIFAIVHPHIAFKAFYDIVRKKLRSKRGKTTQQQVAKLRLTAKEVLLSIWWDWKGIIHCYMTKHIIRLSTVNNCTVQSWRFIRNGQNWPIRDVLCSIRTPPGHTRL